MAHVLETEVETWEKHKEELLRLHEGKFVLIKGDQMYGIFPSVKDAYRSGLRQFGNVPMLIKEIMAEELPVSFGGGNLTVAH